MLLAAQNALSINLIAQYRKFLIGWRWHLAKIGSNVKGKTGE
jgi:hypothetical protein